MDTIKRGRTTLVAVMLAVIVAYAVWWRWGLQHEPDGAGVVLGDHQHAAQVDDAPINPVVPSEGSDATRAAATVPAPLPTGPSRVSVMEEHLRIGMDDPLRLPSSKEELAWFERQGYPSSAALEEAAVNVPQEWTLRFRAGTSALELARAESFALLNPARAAEAIVFLEEAATSGSIYALEALSRVHAHPSAGNPLIADAYQFAAELRGNWALAGMRGQRSPSHAYLAAVYGHRIIEEINATRVQRGLPALGVDSRPGLSDFIQRVEEAAMNR